MKWYLLIFLISLKLSAQDVRNSDGGSGGAVLPQQLSQEQMQQIIQQMQKNSQAPAQPANQPNSNIALIAVTGTVKSIRENPITQVFINESGEGYTISENVNYNKIYNVMVEALRKRKAVSFKVDKKSRTIMDVDANPQDAVTYFEDTPAPSVDDKKGGTAPATPGSPGTPLVPAIIGKPQGG